MCTYSGQLADAIASGLQPSFGEAASRIRGNGRQRSCLWHVVRKSKHCPVLESRIPQEKCQSDNRAPRQCLHKPPLSVPRAAAISCLQKYCRADVPGYDIQAACSSIVSRPFNPLIVRSASARTDDNLSTTPPSHPKTAAIARRLIGRAART